MKKHIHKIRRISTHSYSIVVPKEFIKKYNWREKQKVVLTDKGRGRIELRDWRKK